MKVSVITQRYRWLVVAFGAVAITACASGDDQGDPGCSSDADCTARQKCIDSVCDWPLGSIHGKVLDPGAQPVEGAMVTVFGTDRVDVTDADGSFFIEQVPAASPRYILTADMPGRPQAQAGNIEVLEGQSTEVNLTLLEDGPDYLYEELELRVAYLMEVSPTTEILQPDPDAVLDTSLYPPEVLPYLLPGKHIDSDHPDVVAQAHEILDGVPMQDRAKQTLVARAVYEWVVQNIAFDLMDVFPEDVTSGNWQTTFGGWGHSFAEWEYIPSEALRERRSICLEYERLATALLRALDIPARPTPLRAHPVTQWWVQIANGSGYWANMETSIGRSAYIYYGDLSALFPSRPDSKISHWGINQDAPHHVLWWTDNPCLWKEHYGIDVAYQHNASGLARAQASFENLSSTGLFGDAEGDGPHPDDQPYYDLYSRGFAINLANIGTQETLLARFPVFPTTQYNRVLEMVIWTNHPEWVIGTGNEEECDETTGECLSYYVVTIAIGG